MAGRFGGDEFVIVLDEIHELHNATAVADRILASMRLPFFVRDRTLEVRCSIGVSTSTRSHASIDELIHDADAAMYVAKAAGGHRYIVSDESMRGHIRPRAS